MNKGRIKKLIEKAVSKFSLDLSGLTVLTEAASGYYSLTPIIAAAGRAESVLALTRDSQYGRASEIHDLTLDLAHQFGIDSKIEILFKRDDPRIKSADIVTNLGFVRPINKDFLLKLKKSVVIPLMWETWEYRQEDLDLQECRRLGIPVLGTNENHPDLEIYRYVGLLAIKLLFELDIEVFRSKILVIGSGDFGKYTIQSLLAAGALVSQLDIIKGDSLKDYKCRNTIRDCDAIVLVEHVSGDSLISHDGQITPNELYELNPSVSIAHISGGVNREELIEAGIPCIPKKFASPGYMSVATDYMGPSPLINLHTVGLKIGECLARAIQNGMYAIDAELEVLNELEYAQGFGEIHKR